MSAEGYQQKDDFVYYIGQTVRISIMMAESNVDA